MTAPSSFEIAQGFSNNVGRSHRRQNDISAIDEILVRANQTGNPQDIDSAMSQILQRVSPERQQGALALLQKKQSDLMQIKENAALKKNYNVNLNDINDPSIRQQLASTGIQQNAAMEKANRSGNVDYNQIFTGKAPASIPSQETSQVQQGQRGAATTPNAAPIQQPANQAQRTQTNQQGLGNAPVNATTGQIQPVLDVNQLFEKGKQIAAAERANGNPVTDQQGFDIANAINNANITHNRNVEAERTARSASQEAYGKIADAALHKYFPGNEVLREGDLPQILASPKIQAMIHKKAEEYAQSNSSEAEIKAKLFEDVKNIKDKLSNVESSPKPKRAWTKLGQKSLDTGREAEKEEIAIRNKIKPLLDMGLYDETRVALAKTDRYPEEIESLVTSLGENANRVIAELSPLKKVKAPKKEQFSTPPTIDSFLTNTGQPWKRFIKEEVYTPEDMQKFGQNLEAAIQNDPSTNLILLRKAYEDKGVDWRLFKDELDRIVDEGQFQMSPEQDNQYDRLDEPPLDGLDKILFDFNLKGR